MSIKTWRLSVVLVLLAAGLLLAVPGVAGAQVKAKYRAEYKAKLTSFTKAFNAFARNYDNMQDGSITVAQDMAPMIGDPDQRESLVEAENWCLSVYNSCKGKPYTWSMAYGKSINAFSGKAKRYFAKATQQRKFKTACLHLKANSAILIWLANDLLYESYLFLSKDLPEIDLATKAVADADEHAASGHEGFDKWIAKLHALR